jgi:hypothetical protein
MDQYIRVRHIFAETPIGFPDQAEGTALIPVIHVALGTVPEDVATALMNGAGFRSTTRCPSVDIHHYKYIQKELTLTTYLVPYTPPFV